MGRSTQVRMADALAIMRLLADVAALKSDPNQQRQVLIDGLNRIIGTNQSFFYVADGWRPGGEPRWAHRTLSTEIDPVVLRYMSEFGVKYPLVADPFAPSSIADAASVQVRTLQQVLPDLETCRRHEPFMDIISSGRVADGLVAFHRVANQPGRIIGVGMHRFRTSGKLSARQVAMMRLATEELQRMVEVGHLVVPASADLGAQLTPRLQQVLDLVLAGDAPKRIAHVLGLSLWTVREYIQRLYAHFKVSGRDELMSRFVNGAGKG